MPRFRWTFGAAVMVLGAFALSCAGGGNGGEGPEVPRSVSAAPAAPRVVKAFPNLSFEKPTDLQAPPDGTNRLFVLEQAGRVRVFPNQPQVQDAGVFLDIRDKVVSGGEMGLLGLAFHPDFENNRTFYVNYTAPNPRRTVIARYRQQLADPNLADPQEEVILEIEQPYANHNGGQLAFGPDGFLYIGMGDGGAGGDPHNHGQNRKTLLGSWLRIDVDKTSGDRPYAIPADNPYAGNGEGFREEIYAYGLRNLWRFSYDAESGRWWGLDVGQNSQEEVDLLEKGKNYGWRIMEGDACFNPRSGCDQSGLTMPVVTYGRDMGQSGTGGYVYRGERRPELQGAYVYADYVSGRVWTLRYENGQVQANQLLLQTDLNISSFGEDAAQELYMLDHGGGGLHRFE